MQTVTADPAPAGARGWGIQVAPPRELDVEIVIPVYNEERALAGSIHRLHHFLDTRLPFSWQITIVDNASTDITPEIARTLAAELDRVRVMRLERKGRGRALRAAWSASHARVVAYMDVDLSTDLHALLPLLAPLLSGHSEVAIGSRLAPGSRVTRGREARAHLARLQPASCVSRCARGSPTPNAASRRCAPTCCPSSSTRCAISRGSSTPSC